MSLPTPQLVELRDRLEKNLGDEPGIEGILARIERWGPDLIAGIEDVYPESGLAERIIDIVSNGLRARSHTLRMRDRIRLLTPDWFQRPDAVGYAAYADRFAGTLNGVRERIPYLSELGVTYLHLMPLLEPRPGESDGGYAVMDYRKVREDLGTMRDLASLAEALHESDITLTLDLVLNHVAAEHEWAVKARAGDPKYRDYFYIYPDREMPDQYERTLPEVFPDFAPGNFTWDDDLNGWVWTTFNSFQWDVNWTNPDVLCEYIDIIINLANQGVDCLRLDAIAFIVKRMGTNCTNQPEVHGITQILRAAAHIAAPSLIFKAEAIVAPDDLVAYLGRGRHAGRVSDIAYHNSLMVQIWSALASRDARLLAVAMSRFQDIPTTTAWATYVRCHDDIGWAIANEDCEALALNGFEHRRFLSDFYSGAHPASFADGLVFQENPQTLDRRISGTAASLVGLGRGHTAAERRLALDRLMLAYAMAMGFGGLPLIYMGDELALLNDDDFASVPEHADDNRWAHRPAMPWDIADARATTVSDAASAYSGLHRMVHVRRSLESLHASVPTRIYTTSHPSVVCFVRRHPAGDLVQVYNVSDVSVALDSAEILGHGWTLAYDRLSERYLPVVDGHVTLPPYATLWLTEPV
ncbi:amylosucrase [Demequina sp.]|uniref:amylosucrase n=1 Tax=Demequina sp. TaxID=2050685 RepID=UPI0025D7FEC8|nr:amylosucrase [Demequina sp.]